MIYFPWTEEKKQIANPYVTVMCNLLLMYGQSRFFRVAESFPVLVLFGREGALLPGPASVALLLYLPEHAGCSGGEVEL